MDQSTSVLTQLASARQQVDTLEKEVEARSRENVLLKQQLQELTDFAEGLTVSMPGHWSLEEQNTALRLVLRAIREQVAEEEVTLMDFTGKDLPSLIRMIMAENEERGREIRKLERKNEELNICVNSLEEKEDNKGDSFNAEKSNPSEPLGDIVQDSSDGEDHFARMSDLNHEIMRSEMNINSTITADEKIPQATHSECSQLVKSSRARLRTSNQCSSSPIASPYTPPASPTPLSFLTDKEFCDLQIRLLEAGHDLSKQDQLVVEEMTNKLSGVDMLEMEVPTEEILEPCQVTLSGLGWGPSPGDVVRHVRKYEGVIEVRVDGDMAVLQFRNMEWADKFRGEGGHHVIEGCSLMVGEIMLIEEVGTVHENLTIKVEEEIVSSVAVRVKRRGVTRDEKD